MRSITLESIDLSGYSPEDLRNCITPPAAPATAPIPRKPKDHHVPPAYVLLPQSVYVSFDRGDLPVVPSGCRALGETSMRGSLISRRRTNRGKRDKWPTNGRDG